MTRKQHSIILISSLVFLLVVGWLSWTVQAQLIPATTIGWFVIASGSGASSGATSGDNIIMESTVGQPMVGSSAGGVATFEAGYWSAEEARGLYLPVLLK
jgi:hypothetical protein